jgi:hypothetical protein
MLIVVIETWPPANIPTGMFIIPTSWYVNRNSKPRYRNAGLTPIKSGRLPTHKRLSILAQRIIGDPQLQKESARYPRFFDDGKSPAYVLLENYCMAYIKTLARDLMCIPIPDSLSEQATPLLRVQQKLSKREAHILELVEFQVRTRLSNLSSIHDSQAIHELPTEEFSIQINNRKMLPVLEVMMEIHQHNEMEHSVILRTIEGDLATILNKVDQTYIDNPFSPFSLCSIIYSSVSPLDLEGADLALLMRLFSSLLNDRLADFYTHFASGITALGRKNQIKQAVDYSQRT